MTKSKKKRCQGCAALKKRKDGSSYECKLGHTLSWVKQTNTGEISAPTPEEECLKPKTEEELKEAKKAK